MTIGATFGQVSPNVDPGDSFGGFQNHDLKLKVPLSALASMPDKLLVVTAGGRPLMGFELQVVD